MACRFSGVQQLAVAYMHHQGDALLNKLIILEQVRNFKKVARQQLSLSIFFVLSF